MKVDLAKYAGFCGGVARAFVIVEKEFRGRSPRKKGRVLILGSLVHNEGVMKKIEEMGIKKIKNLRSVKKGDTVIVTAHGVGEKVIQKIKERGAKVFDATCPKVKQVHNHARDYFKKGHEVVIFGDRGHKETKGINGWCDNRALIVEDPVEAKKVEKILEKKRQKKPIVFLQQTTQSLSEFEKIKEILKKIAKKQGRKLKIIKTICIATASRQPEAKIIAKRNDCVLVVGGKNSANTKRLWLVAKKENKNVLWIESLGEKEKRKIKNKFKNCKKVGVLSGASTPKWDIEEAVEFLREGIIS